MASFSRRLFLGAGTAAVLATAGAARAAANSGERRTFAPGDTAYVDVAVATLWTEPDIDRAVDAAAVANPADLRAWVAKMTLAQRRWLVGNLESAACYGTPVVITEESGGWAKIVVPSQPTPRDERGYPGWVPAAQLTDKAPGSADVPFALVTSATTWLHEDAELGTRFMEVSYGSRLPVLEETATAVKVSTSTHGDKWLNTDEVTVHESDDAIPAPSGGDLVADAKMFLDLPYVWGGTSGFGFDCSGFTHGVYKVHGVTIARDAGPQMDQAEPVPEAELQAGDLLFYGGDRIHHVAMHIGDDSLIDARTNTDTTEQLIEIVKVADHPYAHEFAGAVRYL